MLIKYNIRKNIITKITWKTENDIHFRTKGV